MLEGGKAIHDAEQASRLVGDQEFVTVGGWTGGARVEATLARPPEPPFLVAVNDRLDRLGKLLDEGRGMAAVLRERTMGPWAEEAGSPAGGGDISEFGMVLGRLDGLIAIARQGCEHVGALASRI